LKVICRVPLFFDWWQRLSEIPACLAAYLDADAIIFSLAERRKKYAEAHEGLYRDIDLFP